MKQRPGECSDWTATVTPVKRGKEEGGLGRKSMRLLYGWGNLGKISGEPQCKYCQRSLSLSRMAWPSILTMFSNFLGVAWEELRFWQKFCSRFWRLTALLIAGFLLREDLTGKLPWVPQFTFSAIKIHFTYFQTATPPQFLWISPSEKKFKEGLWDKLHSYYHIWSPGDKSFTIFLHYPFRISLCCIFFVVDLVYNIYLICDMI